MKAIVHDRYGADGISLRDVPEPVPGEGEVLIRVAASSVNPAEWYGVLGPPFVRLVSRQPRRPKDPRVGADVAGTVEAVGGGVTQLRAGDHVFGTAPGAWGELAVGKERRLAHKPADVGFADAAGVPIAGITALQALRDHAAVQPNASVIINGASGGVGTYAIQIAKVLGLNVTAVCSTRNVELARELGADEVVDYTSDDFTRSNRRYDAIIDIAGSRSFMRFRRVLAEDARVVIVGAKMTYSLLGPLKHMAGTYVQAAFRSQKVKFFIADITTADLAYLGELMADGRIRTVVDRDYTFAEARDALAYLGEGHARGKVLMRPR